MGGRASTQGYAWDSTRQQFTGYERDAETGLDYAQARHFSSSQGRFTSPDPLGASMKAGDPQSFNRYSYTQNEEVAAQCGAEVIWLAPYSPDFSPIELMWSKVKTSLRAAKARTREELERALVAALELVTDADCLGWFKHCGYQVTRNRN